MAPPPINTAAPPHMELPASSASSKSSTPSARTTPSPVEKQLSFQSKFDEEIGAQRIRADSTNSETSSTTDDASMNDTEEDSDNESPEKKFVERMRMQRRNSDAGDDNPAVLRIPDEYRAKVINADDHLMINPKKPFRMSWDLLVLMPLLMYLLVSLPFRLCFVNEPSLRSGMFFFELSIEMIFIVDIMFNFRTGFYKADYRGVATEDVEFDRLQVAKKYV
jgi:hypothetical protein